MAILIANYTEFSVMNNWKINVKNFDIAVIKINNLNDKFNLQGDATNCKTRNQMSLSLFERRDRGYKECQNVRVHGPLFQRNLHMKFVICRVVS